MWLRKVPWVPQLETDKTVHHSYLRTTITYPSLMYLAYPLLPSLSLLAVLSFLTFMGSPRDCGFVSSILVHSLTLALALHGKCDLL